MIFTLYGILIIYFLFILILNRGIKELKYDGIEGKKPFNSFSVIIPFRNEIAHLPLLLECLESLDYPKDRFEIILVDDGSTDGSTEFVKRYLSDHHQLEIQLFANNPNPRSPKKEAVNIGIQNASYPWILTTDADCQPSKFWLRTLDAYIQSNEVEMLVAPVTYASDQSFLQQFQLMDFLSLQGTTMGLFGLNHQYSTRPILCNGSNFCYSKKLFDKIQGFEGNWHIASGDDIFLLEKAVDQYPQKVKFVKSLDCLVQTGPKSSWSGLFSQRIRWASKTSSYEGLFAKMTGFLIFLANLSLILSLLLSAFRVISWMHTGILFLIKFNVDFLLLLSTARFFEQEEVLKSYFLSALIHPFFIAFVVLLSLRSNYRWKGRSHP